MYNTIHTLYLMLLHQNKKKTKTLALKETERRTYAHAVRQRYSGVLGTSNKKYHDWLGECVNIHYIHCMLLSWEHYRLPLCIRLRKIDRKHKALFCSSCCRTEITTSWLKKLSAKNYSSWRGKKKWTSVSSRFSILHHIESYYFKLKEI